MCLRCVKLCEAVQSCISWGSRGSKTGEEGLVLSLPPSCLPQCYSDRHRLPPPEPMHTAPIHTSSSHRNRRPCPTTAQACRAAVAFLAREAAAKDYRLDAVHLAICLQHAAVLDPSPADGGGGGGRALDVGSLIHRYGKEFLYTDPQVQAGAVQAGLAVGGGLPGSRSVRVQGCCGHMQHVRGSLLK